MTYLKNIRPTKALENENTPHYVQHQEDPNTSHLRILGSTVYVFLHEEERELKSEKWKPRALRGKLVGLDGHTIYRVYIEEQAKVIRIKDLRIFEDYEPKEATDLPTYEKTPTFRGFPAGDNDDDKDMAKRTPATDAPSTSPPSRMGIDSAPKSPLHQSPVPKSRAGRTIKPTVKARQMFSKKTPPTPLQTDDTRALITHLVKLLDVDWNKAQTTTDETLSLDKDPIGILANRLHSEANALNESQFVCSTQLDVEEPESYHRVMQCPYASQWSQAMKEELDSLHENNTWTLIRKSEMEPGHQPLGGKWVYKVKRDVEGKIARFKARWVVKGYLQQFGVDFDQTYAAVLKPMAFRVLL